MTFKHSERDRFVQATVREGGPNVYETFNIIVRRDPKENNFKAVLESIRDLMNSQVSVCARRGAVLTR